MGINMLKSGGLAKPEKLIVDKAILNRIKFLYNIYNLPTICSYKVAYKRIGTNRHTDTNETFRAEGSEENIRAKVSEGGAGIDDVVRRIESSLLGDALGEDGGLRRR